MFDAPVRQAIDGNVGFYLRLVTEKDTGIRLELTRKGFLPDAHVQPLFNALRSSLITELTKQTQIFKNAPTTESLELITPNWGFLYENGTPTVLSPYTNVNTNEIESAKLPCIVELVFIGVSITRSRVQPYFQAKYCETVSDTLIDFQWDAPQKPDLLSNEVEEVSDIASAPDQGTVHLRDPARILQEKLEAKERVREAYRKVEQKQATFLNQLKQLKGNADKLAHEFEQRYDLSDSESAFSEWASESENEESTA